MCACVCVPVCQFDIHIWFTASKFLRTCAFAKLKGKNQCSAPVRHYAVVSLTQDSPEQKPGDFGMVHRIRDPHDGQYHHLHRRRLNDDGISTERRISTEP